MVRIFDINYSKADLDQVASNATHMKSEERTQLLRVINYFEDLFDGTLGDWDTYFVELELKTDSELFNSKYYTVPIINKESFRK